MWIKLNSRGFRAPSYILLVVLVLVTIYYSFLYMNTMQLSSDKLRVTSRPAVVLFGDSITQQGFNNDEAG